MDLMVAHQLHPSTVHGPGLDLQQTSTPPVAARSSPGASRAEAASPADTSASFLTRIAAQERRVLEMREELLKAEHELQALKRQWATHDAIQKTSASPDLAMDCRKREQVSASIVGFRRPAQRRLRGNTEAGAMRSGQRVFSSSRHTRTLSLLSGKDTAGPAPSTPTKKEAGSASQVPAKDVKKAPQIQGSERRPSDREDQDLIQSGRQLVGDFRSGFWTCKSCTPCHFSDPPSKAL